MFCQENEAEVYHRIEVTRDVNAEGFIDKYPYEQISIRCPKE